MTSFRPSLTKLETGCCKEVNIRTKAFDRVVVMLESPSNKGLQRKIALFIFEVNVPCPFQKKNMTGCYRSAGVAAEFLNSELILV